MHSSPTHSSPRAHVHTVHLQEHPRDAAYCTDRGPQHPQPPTPSKCIRCASLLLLPTPSPPPPRSPQLQQTFQGTEGRPEVGVPGLLPLRAAHAGGQAADQLLWPRLCRHSSSSSSSRTELPPAPAFLPSLTGPAPTRALAAASRCTAGPPRLTPPPPSPPRPAVQHPARGQTTHHMVTSPGMSSSHAVVPCAAGGTVCHRAAAASPITSMSHSATCRHAPGAVGGLGRTQSPPPLPLPPAAPSAQPALPPPLPPTPSPPPAPHTPAALLTPQPSLLASPAPQASSGPICLAKHSVPRTSQGHSASSTRSQAGPPRSADAAAVEPLPLGTPLLAPAWDPSPNPRACPTPQLPAAGTRPWVALARPRRTQYQRQALSASRLPPRAWAGTKGPGWCLIPVPPLDQRRCRALTAPAADLGQRAANYRRRRRAAAQPTPTPWWCSMAPAALRSGAAQQSRAAMRRGPHLATPCTLPAAWPAVDAASSCVSCARCSCLR